MSRAEMKRKAREEEARRKKQNAAMAKASIPAFQLPPAPMRATNLSDQEVANLTGTTIAILENWRKEQTEKIRKLAILEAQEKLDKAEQYITLCNIITSLKALDGFRYGKAAANYLLDHYYNNVETSEKQNVKKTYEELHEKWGIEIEFDEYDLNKELGFDEVDWVYEYIGMHIPMSVYDRIWNDSKNIQSVMTQLAVIWELCEDFRFSKHRSGEENMLDKFMKGTKVKYDLMEVMENSVEKVTKLLKDRYDITINWSEGTNKTIERFRP